MAVRETINYKGHYSRGGKSSVWIIKRYSKYMNIFFIDKQGNRKAYYYSKGLLGNSVYYQMLDLARSGKGLNSYIIKNKISYKRKWDF